MNPMEWSTGSGTWLTFLYNQEARMAESIKMEKYSSLRAKLAQENSESDEENNETTQILCELLPAYYQYRKHLGSMLKETNFNPRLSPSIVVPQQYLEQQIAKCEQEKLTWQQKNKNNLSSRVSRMLLTEKLIQKNRKKQKEEKQLQQKYEAQQIEALMQKQPHRKMNQQQVTFEPQRVSAAQNLPRSSQRVLLRNETQLQSQDPSILEISEERVIEASKRNSKKIGNKDHPTKNRVKANGALVQNIHVVQTDRYDQILGMNKESERPLYQRMPDNQKPASGARHTQVMRNESRQKMADSIKGREILKVKNDHEQSKASSSDKGSAEGKEEATPKIRINYYKLDGSRDNERSQDDDFSEIAGRSGSVAQVNQSDDDGTYSQQKAKPYLRHNTPNFDTFSQKVRASNFFDEQKQKLLAQHQFAEAIRHEVDVVLAEDESVSIDSKIQKFSGHNLLLDNLENINSTKEWPIQSRGVPEDADSQFQCSFRFLLFQICDLYSNAECYKYLLQHRQYEILKNLYSEDIGKGPVFAKLVTQKIQQLLGSQQKSETNTIVAKIFGSQSFISFEDFGYIFSSNLVETEYSVLSSRLSSKSPLQLKQMLSRLFSVWLEIHYFETKIKKLSQTNSRKLASICPKVTRSSDQTQLDYEELEKFIYSTSRNRTNGLKIRTLCAHYFPNGKFSEISCWLLEADKRR